MKKLLIIQLTIFIISLNSAQTIKGKYGKKYIKNKSQISTSSNSTSSTPKIPTTSNSGSSISYNENAKQFADEIAKASGEYIFLRENSENSGKSKIFRYILASVKDKTTYYTKKTCKECMDIEFKLNNNKNYIFSHVWGNFTDLFPVWKSLFYPSANKADYNVNTQTMKVEWKTYYKGNEVIFGRLGGEAWYIIMK